MLKILQEKYKSNWKSHIKNSFLLTTTYSIKQLAIQPISCYLGDKTDCKLTLFSVSKAIIFSKQIMIIMFKIGKRRCP